uniref:Uncharacterized protein n=1 Tax=Pinctada fucata TaxID=50426 RepID=A0A516EKH5_PINFU|nr:hypothetical protein [Pinctada fucata]
MQAITIKLAFFLFFSGILTRVTLSEDSGCRSLIDFCIVVDGSDSISRDDFSTLRKAISSLIDRLNIDKDEGRMGIVVYSSKIARKVPLTSDKWTLQKEAEKLPHPRDGTNTALGIETMKELFQASPRPGVPKVGIVVTDGISKNTTETVIQANLTKDLGINMFSVGVSQLIDMPELIGIASSERQVLTVDSFDALARNIEELVLLVCPTSPVPTTTMKPAPTPPPTQAPISGPCDKCKMQNGVGYNPHPDDCDKFTQCYFGGENQIMAVYRQCPFGQYWDQGMLTCRPSAEVNCPNDKCRHPRLLSYPYQGTTSCRAYWKCNFGKAIGMCCPEGYEYNAFGGCVKSKKCNDTCPPQLINEGPCDKRPSWKNEKGFEQYVYGFGWVDMPCAPGSRFDCNTCECSLHTSFLPGRVCRPEVHIPFDKNCKDESGKAVYVENIDVTLTGTGLGYFNGNTSKLIIPRFANVEHYSDFVIKMRFMDVTGGVRGMVSNGDCCSNEASLKMVKSERNIHYLAKCSRGATSTFYLPFIPGNWNEAYYMHDTKKLEGKVNGIGMEKWAYGSLRRSVYGPLKKSAAGLQIGFVKGFENFHGYMDYVTIYMCRPTHLR